MRSTYRFCALLLAVFLVSCGGTSSSTTGPAPHHITLEVRSGPTHGEHGFIDTTGTNGQVYHYHYSGGRRYHNGDETGNVFVHSSEGKDVPITITLQGNYKIKGIKFFSDNEKNPQLTSKPQGSDLKTWVITDKNSVMQAAYYLVTVSDESVTPAVEFDCDPGVVNN